MGIGTAKQWRNQGEDGRERKQQRLVRPQKVENRHQAWIDPVSLLRADNVNRRQHTPHAKHRYGNAGKANLARTVNVDAQAGEAQHDRGVDNSGEPFPLQVPQHQKRRNSEGASSAQYQRDITFDRIATLFGLDNVAPGLKPRINLFHRNATRQSTSLEATEESAPGFGVVLVVPVIMPADWRSHIQRLEGLCH